MVIYISLLDIITLNQKIKEYYCTCKLRVMSLVFFFFFFENIKVMFGNSFCFLFSKTYFWEYKEKIIFLIF